MNNEVLTFLYPQQNTVLGGYTIFSLSEIPQFHPYFKVFDV